MGNSILGEGSARSEAPSGNRLGFLWCGRHTVLSLGEVKSRGCLEAIHGEQAGLSWRQQQGYYWRASGLLRGPLHFSLWTAPWAGRKESAISLQSVLVLVSGRSGLEQSLQPRGGVGELLCPGQSLLRGGPGPGTCLFRCPGGSVPGQPTAWDTYKPK